MPVYTSLITLLIVLYYFGTGIFVARTHSQTGIAAPKMSGDVRLERAIRVQMNAVEFAPILLPSLWLAAFWVSDIPAAVLGAVWLAARLMYAKAYMTVPSTRTLGFSIQAMAVVLLVILALYGIFTKGFH